MVVIRYERRKDLEQWLKSINIEARKLKDYGIEFVE